MKHKFFAGTVALGLIMGLIATGSLAYVSRAFAASDISVMSDQPTDTGEEPSDKTQPGDGQTEPETPDPEKPNPETPGPETPDPEKPEPETPEPENPTPGTPQPEQPTPSEPETGFNDPANQIVSSGSGTNTSHVSISSSSQSSNTITEGSSTSSRPAGQALSQIHVSGNSYTTNSEAIIDAIDETTEREGIEIPKMEADEDSVDVPSTGSEGGVNFLALGLMMIAGITIVAAGVAVVVLNVLAKNTEE